MNTNGRDRERSNARVTRSSILAGLGWIAVVALVVAVAVRLTIVRSPDSQARLCRVLYDGARTARDTLAIDNGVGTATGRAPGPECGPLRRSGAIERVK